MTATRPNKENAESRPPTTTAHILSMLKIAEFLTTGTLVELSGRISSNAWIGKDGEIKSGLNFHTSNVKLHGGGKKE